MGGGQNKARPLRRAPYMEGVQGPSIHMGLNGLCPKGHSLFLHYALKVYRLSQTRCHSCLSPRDLLTAPFIALSCPLPT